MNKSLFSPPYVINDDFRTQVVNTLKSTVKERHMTISGKNISFNTTDDQIFIGILKNNVVKNLPITVEDAFKNISVK